MIHGFSKDGAAWLAVLLILISIVLGGQSRDNPISLAIVGVAAAPLMALSLWRLADGGLRRAWPAVAFVGLLFAVFLVQLVPVPPEVYAAAPGRAQAAAALAVAGVAPSWAPLSMDPDATRRAALALVAPAAMFLATLGLRPSTQADLVLLYLAAGLASVLLGVLQLASRGVGLYVSPETLAGTMSGFFANRNHLAVLLLALLPLGGAGALILRRRNGEGFPTLLALTGFSLVVLLALGLARSRFGILAAAPVLAATLAFVAAGSEVRLRAATLGFLAAAGLALATVGTFGLGPIVDRFAVAQEDRRPEILRYTLAAARPFQPLGAGPGAFNRVFRAVEPPDQVTTRYTNQAHNDYAEGWLEAGLGAVLVAAFGAALYAAWSWRAWRGGLRDPATLLPRAASLGLLVIAVHSTVDYPMRTQAVAVFAAFLFGVLGSTAPGAGRRGG